MTPGPNKSAYKADLQLLQKEHLETVLALTRANSELLLVRQRASGVEIEVMTIERNHAEKNGNAVSDSALAEIHEKDRVAKQALVWAEQNIEEMDCRLAEIASRIAELNN